MGGALGTARFKWSRDNGSIVSAVRDITVSGTQTTLSVNRIGRDQFLRFQIGDWVTIRLEDGEQVHHLIVHPAEAGLDTNRISSDSPLATAILGKRVGDVVTIDAPSGTYEATIVESSRSAV